MTCGTGSERRKLIEQGFSDCLTGFSVPPLNERFDELGRMFRARTASQVPPFILGRRVTNVTFIILDNVFAGSSILPLITGEERTSQNHNDLSLSKT